jgi:hypothetical protein
MGQNYKEEIVNAVQNIEDEKLLRYLYILVSEMINKLVKT